MVTVWWSVAAVIYYKILHPSEANTTERYCQQINDLQQKYQRMCPALVNMRRPILLYENARTQVI